MGAIGGDAPVQWDKVDGAEVANGGGGGAAGRLEKILVSVRLRPLSDKEIARGDPAEWECINDTTIISRSTFPDRPTAPTAYSFDRVFRSDCNTKEVYDEGAKAVALSVVSGINSSVFAYGQTSSGKTYTMTGITEHTAADIYDYIAKHEERAFVLKFSAIEIYNEVVRDLLSAESTSLRLWDDAEKGTYVENLTEVILRDSNHLKELISVCEAQRRTGETYLNENSSRSHQILKLTIESSAREFLGKDKSTTLVASVNFVDLAGSERASQALSAGARLKEGCHINRSLLTLGTVIRKLSKVRNGHIPYRDSKLTRILAFSRRQCKNSYYLYNEPSPKPYGQSRNTLLFASCAKEVVTNAQVNVVMSDKALVKQLQKELARLESELRCPTSYSGLEALVKEKDNQIRKMEKEIKELKLQRDLAQSRLQDLLKVVGDSHSSKHPLASSGRNFTFDVPQPCEDERSTTSEVVSSGQNFRLQGRQTIQRDYRSQQSENDVQFATPLSYSVSSPPFSGMPPTNGRDDNSQISNEDSEDLCKEVRCIETNETEENECLESSAVGSNSLQDSNVASSMQGGNHPNRSVNSRQHDASPITLEQHLENVKKPFANLGMDLGSSTHNSSRSRVIGRSRSCRSLMSSTLLEDLEKEDCTPPSRSFMDYPGRPETCQRRVPALNYDAESETLSRAGSMLSEIITTRDGLKGNSSVAGDTEFVAGIGEFVAELKEMAQVQYQKQHGDQGDNGELAEGTIRSVGLDPIMDALQSPSRWPLEFEKKQQEIIDLWHGCNVSLVHRTYFFLLFKGDPADAIYMEVELRRLSFLKNTTYSNGSMGRNVVVAGSPSTSLVSSAKKLQREREMLCRQMQKRLTIQERESLYTKWGVSLSSKRRRLQVARRLWTETKNLEHVRESASLVARLIGLLEPGKALREMFGLSFAPQQFTRRSHSSWRYGRSSLD
ncbi:LOW QUALITY PROTEIN: kinesin-like protein KIN-7F [Sorghum bicolor]|uniref:LOW QUALITY PROTEIN: kinesin-like protein KIN-7F n=1 Tax=Sorghum bicolor TaxID=4558 RepID=UPI000B4256FC|nr:LOW QUALITY PROTEIN: kinesin-like protein KIN-7F [Sorghum bicolor]|eukprot:XP_021319014.1 LOW QUALITY PROTEIN: kinesin-like protein KIN-7F [Sorghum bicolor]